MQQAILKTLKDADGTYAFPSGANKIVDLFCDGEKVEIIEVLINNSFAEFSTYAAGRVAALKLVSDCETVYVLGTKNDIENLQNCCGEKKNITIGLGCDYTNGDTVTVFDILGNELGFASTPTDYIDLWNASSNNQIIGKLFPLSGWTFNLNYNIGNVIVSSLQCNTSTEPILGCPFVTASVTTSAINLSWPANTLAFGWNIKWYSDAGTTLIETDDTDDPDEVTASKTGLTANTTYYYKVSPKNEDGSLFAGCPLQSVKTAPAARVVEWEFFDDEPTGLDALSYSHSQAHLQDANISIPLTGMDTDQWFVLRFPSDETNVTSWYNTPLNNFHGPIPDSVFASITTIGQWKYLKTQSAVTFDITKPLQFSH